ncbi:MAG: hypothetical protein ACLFUU_13720 [Desulfobacteraceae bacterium]
MSPITAWLISVALLGLLALMPVEVQGHGVEGRLESGGVVIGAYYQGGEVMCHARVTVQAPDSDQTFQRGNTDRNGRFAFAPDRPGNWRLVIADDMGHRLNYEVSVDAQHLTAGTAQPVSSAFGTAVKAWFGISLILFVASGLLWWQAHKILKRQATPSPPDDSGPVRGI